MFIKIIFLLFLKSASSLGNHNEIMGQYNRLLDVFENNSEPELHQVEAADAKSIQQFELLKKSKV